MNFLRFVGRHAGIVMLGGMVVVAFLPGVSTMLRPFLPVLVSLVLGLAIARLDLGAILGELGNGRSVAGLFALLIVFGPLTCLGMVWLGQIFGASSETLLALAVFGASPPLSSAANLALLLGYNARITLKFGLLATVALPFLGPFSLGLVGVQADIAPVVMAQQIALMIAGGIFIGLALQVAIGKSKISVNSEAFNGVAALAMILFLFPLFDGVGGFVIAKPMQAFGLLCLALLLNFGGHVAVAFAARRVTDPDTASALGMMFGNRNVSFFLAVLPANPALGLFIAASQIPIYSTPAIFGRRR
ncbi:hypothetical protein [Litoreibacter janthinus]|uniref:Bile acid:Na+ symporter, BASS family n=1 Tax=Litoreibacter janthinus TaxID=670154 RepID=A0A1I6FRH2_9RHOB|nr:hypothetical protein [Litoreibacter janthinus]SFR32498.1 hypothetical protein SAMN04488002_0144 [Litoreibacter janthinus]